MPFSNQTTNAQRPTMLAARIHEFGDPDVIELEEVEISSPGEGEVLVKIRAAGVGPWDAWIRTGKSALPQRLPLTLGSDISGMIAAVGPDVNTLKPGDAVFGVTNPRFVGGYAEFAIAQAGMIAHKPSSLSDIEAASVPVVAVTAWQMLFEAGGFRAGMRVFVHGGAGNVGAFAVQLARLHGARVIASAFNSDRDYVSTLGAGTVVDIAEETLREAEHSCDLIVDTVGGRSQEALFRFAKPGTRFISSVAAPPADKAKEADVDARFIIVSVNKADLTKIADLLQSRQLRTCVGEVLPLSQARAAHEMLAGTRPHKRGKIVLQF